MDPFLPFKKHIISYYEEMGTLYSSEIDAYFSSQEGKYIERERNRQGKHYHPYPGYIKDLRFSKKFLSHHVRVQAYKNLKKEIEELEDPKR